MRHGESGDFMGFVVVASFANRIEAGIAGGLLESNGIRYSIRGDDIGIFGPGHVGPSVLGVRLLVEESDAEVAHELLRDAGLVNED